MVLGKAAWGEMSGLWRVEVPCALPFVRAARQPSVFMRISVCGSAHMCVGTTEKGSAAKTVRKIRAPKAERWETNKQIKAAVLTPWGRTSLFVLPWPFCFLLQNKPENRDSVWCQSKGKHPLFKSREERMYRLYWGRAIPSWGGEGGWGWCKLECSEYKVQIAELFWLVRGLVAIYISVTEKTSKATSCSGFSLAWRNRLFWNCLCSVQGEWHKG